MCNRPIAWREDENVSGGSGGSHNLIPVMCDEYVKALEDALMGDTGIRAWPDNSVVNSIRKSLNMPELALPDVGSAPCPPADESKPDFTCPYCKARFLRFGEMLSDHIGREHPGQEVPGWTV